MSNIQIKKYTWKHIIDTLVIPKDELDELCYEDAIDYYSNFYNSDDPSVIFSEENVKYIQEEIKEEAEYRIRLAKTDKKIKDLKASWPGLDDYIKSIGERGPFPR